DQHQAKCHGVDLSHSCYTSKTGENCQSYEGNSVVTSAKAQKYSTGWYDLSCNYRFAPLHRAKRYGRGGGVGCILGVEVGLGGGVCARNVLAIRVNILEGAGATPDDHLRSRPNCCVTFSTVGGVGEARGYPTIRARIVSPAGARKAKILVFPAPDDHLARCPHSGMKISRRRRVDGARGCPTIHCGIVSPAGAQLVEIGVVSAP